MVDWNEINFQDFQAALWHLTEQWPRKLERLLKKGQLQQYLTETAQRATKARSQMRRENLDTPNDVIAEIVHNQIIAPQNPKDVDIKDRQLSPEAEKLLEKFNKEVMDAE